MGKNEIGTFGIPIKRVLQDSVSQIVREEFLVVGVTVMYYSVPMGARMAS